MTKKTSISKLRLRVTTNHFKQFLLGNCHIPGSPQTKVVLDTLGKTDSKESFSQNTWQAWFSSPVSAPKTGKANVLDTLAESFIRVHQPRQASDVSLPRGYFLELVHGSWAQGLFSPTKAEDPLSVLLYRAKNHKYFSPLHLHLDAISMLTMSSKFEKISSLEIAVIGAKNILEILACRWQPFHGTVYSELTTDLQLKWVRADANERISIRNDCDRFKPNLFEYFWDKNPQPAWSSIGMGIDIDPSQVSKTLFSLAADPEFLVADRLSTWALDLATAGIATYTLISASQQDFPSHHVTEKMVLWDAIDEIFFSNDELDLSHPRILTAMAHCNAAWEENSGLAFTHARKAYRDTLANLGVTATEILELATTRPQDPQ